MRDMRSPYRVAYDIRDNYGKTFSYIENYVGANPCKLGYTGNPKILECPRSAYKEIILKSQQQAEPAITKGLIRSGNWWITKGFDYPTFNSNNYQINSIKIYDNKSNDLLWVLP